MNNYSYVTYLAGNDYLCMVLMLKHSLDLVNSNYPLTCVTLKDCIKQENIEVMQKCGINIIEKEPLTDKINPKVFSAYQDGSLDNWKKCFSKPVVFGLTEFEKCIYLDADIYVYKNVDDLFEKPHWSSCIDCWGVETANPDWLYNGDNYFRMFNAGMIVYEPSEDIVNAYINKTFQIDTDSGIRWVDENILHLIYPNWRFDHYRKLSIYNDILMGRLDDYMRTEWFNPNEIRIAHFTHKKPQQFTMQELLNGSKRSYWLYYCLQYVLEMNQLFDILAKKGISSEDFKKVV